MKARKSLKRPFTLLEITICIAILGLVASVMGWHLKSMVSSHAFHKEIDHLVVDLRKYQILALSNRIDIELSLSFEDGVYSTIARCAEPLRVIPKSRYKLKHLEKIEIGGKEIKKLDLHIFPTGRISPFKELNFFHKDEQFILDLSQPLQINLSKKEND